MGKLSELYGLGGSVILLLLAGTGCSKNNNDEAAAVKEQAAEDLITVKEQAAKDLIAAKEQGAKNLSSAEEKARELAKAMEQVKADESAAALELKKVKEQAAGDRAAAKKAMRELAVAKKLSEGNLAATRKVAQAQLDKVKEKAAFDLAALKAKTKEEIAATRAEATTQIDSVKSTPSMIYVPGGEFTMGFEGVATPEHKVTLSPFHIGKFEVTFKLWLEVKSFGSANGYAFHQQGRAGTPWAPALPGNNQPVTDICLWDTLAWCNAYSEMEGFEPVYKTADKAVIRDSRYPNAVFDRNAKGYRLPTEAEWEYAARFRGKGDFSPGDFASGASANGSNLKATSEVAWFPLNSPAPHNHPQTVGSRKANHLGVHDMSGNVYEWCWDRQDPYQDQPQKDPVGTKAGGHVLRGGSYGHSDMRVSHRISSNPVNFSVNVGFRCARSH